MRIVCQQTILMKYHAFLKKKKRQNLKLSSASNYKCRWRFFTGIIPFSDCGEFAASLVSGVVSFMVEGRVGSVKG